MVGYAEARAASGYQAAIAGSSIGIGPVAEATDGATATPGKTQLLGKRLLSQHGRLCRKTRMMKISQSETIKEIGILLTSGKC